LADVQVVACAFPTKAKAMHPMSRLSIANRI
jgi:hypothetical protein